jgi:aspartyl-tRNA(Asn)/glutamyl-tRNA(Gln) amidotransferase subunit A
MQLFPVEHETIGGQARAIRAGGRSCVDVLEECLRRIDDREAEVRAWVVVDREGARAQARERDRELAEGRDRGPLHGIPIGIKDIIDVAGLPTTAGSPVGADRPAESDAAVVARLREAGAVILGKTVTTPFAWIDPPPTRNPWRLDRTPGGSSSGSAAAVACGMCLGAIGSQTGGSITRPASFCGVAGLKPTYGRVDETGIIPLAPSLDHPGPLARSVGDLALMWRAICGDAPAAGLAAAPRLGRLRGLFDERADPAMRAAIDRAAEALGTAGATVVEVALPEGFADVLRHHRTIMAAEAAEWHERRLAEQPDAYPPRIRALVEEGLAVRAVDYLRAKAHQETMRRAILACFDGVDALLTPAAAGPAPDPSTTGDPALNAPWSYTGLPTVTFPIGFSADGLPLGIQLAGWPGLEGWLLEASQWCEATIRREIPPVSAAARNAT